MSVRRALLALALLVSPAVHAIETFAHRIEPRPNSHYAFGYAADMLRTSGRGELEDQTIGGIFSVRHPAGIHQWAIGAVTQVWGLPGSRSLLVGFESGVVNEEASNPHPKIAFNAVYKNRSDLGKSPGAPYNAHSIAYWVSAQPGTGFERGLVFDRDSLAAVGKRAAVVDLSDLPDDQIGQVDLIRIRKDVALRYDPATKQLVLHVDPPQVP
jgi:hypothetical protein